MRTAPPAVRSPAVEARRSSTRATRARPFPPQAADRLVGVLQAAAQFLEQRQAKSGWVAQEVNVLGAAQADRDDGSIALAEAVVTSPISTPTSPTIWPGPKGGQDSSHGHALRVLESS